MAEKLEKLLQGLKNKPCPIPQVDYQKAKEWREKRRKARRQSQPQQGATNQPPAREV